MAERDGTAAGMAVQAALLDDPGFLRGIVQGALQAFLEAEMTDHLGAARYERAEGRVGYRNGHKPRTLTTRVGTLELRVPQDREGTFSTELFARYQRNEQALVLALMEMYLQGVSTRKVAAVTEKLCGAGFSKSQVSALAGRLDAALAAWRERPLTAASYPYLVVDARYEHARVGGRVVTLGVLIAAGVRADGRREIVAVEEADTESEATYQELCRRLKERGLRGVELVTSDDHAGLAAAIARHFAQGAPGGQLAALPGAFRAQPARARRRQAPGAAGRGGAGDLRGRGRRASAGRGRRLRRRVAGRPPTGGGQAGGGPGGLPGPLRLPGRAPGAGPEHQRAGAAQPGAEAADAGGADLPQPRGAAAAGGGAGDGAERGVGERAALPGHGPVLGGAAAPTGGDRARPGSRLRGHDGVGDIYRNART